MRTIRATLGMLVLLLGSLFLILLLVEIQDPAQAKLADDGDPFGGLPTLRDYLIQCLVIALLYGTGAWILVREAARGPASRGTRTPQRIHG